MGRNNQDNMQKVIALTPGKRYWFFIDNWSIRKKNGLFTGEYDVDNGNALLVSKNGDIWSIPVSHLHIWKMQRK